MKHLALGFILLISSIVLAGQAAVMLPIGPGKFKTFAIPTKALDKEKKNEANLEKIGKEVQVPKFHLDRTLVSNHDFLNFVKSHHEWQRSEVKSIFADPHYLQHWKSNLVVSHSDLRKPVVFVSWFAASAYCESLGKELPTTNEWEFALNDNGRSREALQAKILNWYSQSNSHPLPPVERMELNGFGVSNLGYVVWEWTSDFNSFLISADSRESGSTDSNFFCGGGSQMGDPSDYAAFMRFSFRASLKAQYTTANLGFRCMKEE